MTSIRSIFTMSPRPANVPDGWRIYNAPRPLPGVYSWQSDDLPGAFYTCQPADADETDLISLNAARVFYLSDEHVQAVVALLLHREDPDDAEESLRDCAKWDFWQDEFHRLVKGKTADEVEMILREASHALATD